MSTVPEPSDSSKTPETAADVLRRARDRARQQANARDYGPVLARVADWLDASIPFSARGHIRPEALAVARAILGETA